ncbi:LYR motif-containing protein 4 isoform X3 [Dama dama]|uniref:LYR motif-containing protein 4 isoform X3 n=1 Tax=Dama dama TaxID=30532 RepID=UPI002A35B690|nr:LYR motif-containing protein 4 isoform X3 [Dama dama]
MAASSRAQVLDLYRAMLRESKRFGAYNYRADAEVQGFLPAWCTRENASWYRKPGPQRCPAVATAHKRGPSLAVPFTSEMSSLAPLLAMNLRHQEDKRRLQRKQECEGSCRNSSPGE